MKTLMIILISCSFCSVVQCKLTDAYHWKTLNFTFPSAEDVSGAHISFIPEMNIPMSIDVFENRLFVSIPACFNGVPCSLAYFELTDTSKSPLLHPYPSWKAHIKANESPEIRSAFRIRIDRCARLWVLDVDCRGGKNPSEFNKLLIYGLHNNSLLRSYDLPKDHVQESTFYSTIAVEDDICEDSYAYIGDLGSSALIIYSWKKNSSWRITHDFFSGNVSAADFYIDRKHFNWPDGLYGLAIAGNSSSGESTLYLHPFASFNEYSVTTTYLKDADGLSSEHFKQKLKFLGSRGNVGPAGASFLDTKSNILFYLLVNSGSVFCWRVNSKDYSPETQVKVFGDATLLIYPSDIKVDANDRLWVLSNRFPKVFDGGLNRNEVNFRIFSSSVKGAIKGTKCDLIEPSPDRASRIAFKNEFLVFLVSYLLFSYFICYFV